MSVSRGTLILESEMKAALIILCGVFGLTLSVPSQAEWTAVISGGNRDVVVYLDYGSVETDDEYIYAWTLTDYKPGIMPNEVRSMKGYEQFACDVPRKTRYLSMQFFKTSMGEGVAYEHNRETQKWQYHAPDSLGDSMLKNICAFAQAFFN